MDYVLFLAGVDNGNTSNAVGINYPVNCTSDRDCMIVEASEAELDTLFACVIDCGRDKLCHGYNLRLYYLDEDVLVVQSALSILNSPNNVHAVKVSDKGHKYVEQGLTCRNLAEINRDVLNRLRAEKLGG